MHRLIIIGAGGHAKSCIDVIECEKKYKILGLVDKNKIKKLGAYKILANDSSLDKIKILSKNAFIGIGQIKSANLRKKMFLKLKKIGFNLPVIKSPHSYISKNSSIGEGTIIMHGAYIGPNVKIGKNCIINNYSHLEHDCQIGDNSHISTRVVLNGSVIVGNETFIGSGTIVKENIKIKKKSIIKFGSLINN